MHANSDEVYLCASSQTTHTHTGKHKDAFSAQHNLNTNMYDLYSTPGRVGENGGGGGGGEGAVPGVEIG